MLIEKPERTVSMRPVTLLVCAVCLIALSTAAAYLILHTGYKRQFDNKDQEILTLQSNNKSLSDKNMELQKSADKTANEFSNLETRFKDLESRLDAAERNNSQTASELALTLKDREISRAEVLKLKSDLEAKSSQLEALGTDRRAMEKRYTSLLETLGVHVVLEPTWVRSGETTGAFDGNLSIVLNEGSDMSKCRKDSEAVVYLSGDKHKENLCLRTGKPETFKYQGGTYFFNLLQSEDNSEGAHRYCIFIYRKR